MRRLLNLKLLWLVPLVFWAVVVGGSFLFSRASIEQHIFDLSATQGRDIFRMVQAMRLWNAEHGGVYVLQSAHSPPNPYLTVPDRDPVTRSGKQLTLINPAYMTRQVAEVIYATTQIRIRMTSLDPINPVNQADAWEARALQEFEKGLPERADLLPAGKSKELRYIAPLITEASCVGCHENQGYKVGSIRGGISVSFNNESIARLFQDQKRNLVLTHLLGWLALSGLGMLTLASLRELMNKLEAARQEQEQLVEKRTAELQAEVRDRRRAEAGLHFLVDSTAYGILGVDAKGVVTFCNRHARELLAPLLENRDLLGHSIMEVLGDAPGFATEYELAMRGAQTGGRLQIPSQFNSTSRSLEYLLNAMVSNGEIEGCVVALSDVTVRQRREDEMWRQAHFDALTALPNRTMFASRMAAVLKTTKLLGGAAVLFVDLDDFKPINDRYGHDVGDMVLVEIAKRLQNNVRGSDFAARLGGDEFVVVLGGVGNAEQAGKVAQKLLEDLAEPIDIGQRRSVGVSASIGVAMFPKDGENIEALLRHADAAMYQAKQSQKGSFGFYQMGQDFPPDNAEKKDDDSV